MSTIDELIKRIDSFDPWIVAIEVLEDMENENSFITKLNKFDQIKDKGINPKGEKLKRKGKTYPVYSPGYEKRKKKLGGNTNFVDFFLRGMFLENEWLLNFTSDYMIIDALDVNVNGFNLTEGMKEFYGQYEGLTEESLEKLRAEFLPRYQNKVREKLLM